MKTTFDYPSYVECSKCGSKFDEGDVNVTNIGEDMLGQDEVTFECPRCGMVVTSKRHK